MDVRIHLQCRILRLDTIDEGNVIAGLQAFPAWQEDLNYPTGARLGALNACGQIAGLVVGPVIAYIDEHFGRKWGIRCESPPRNRLLHADHQSTDIALS
jgi:hypothetical protein